MPRLVSLILLSLFLFCSARAGALPISADGFAELSGSGAGRWAVMALLALATLASEDLTCIAAGLLAGAGAMSRFDAVAACFVGIFAGDMLIFAAGRFLGAPALARAPMRWIVPAKAAANLSRAFARNRAAIVFASRFTPGSRSATSFAAGALRQDPAAFALLFAAAALVWTPLLVLATAELGRGVENLFADYAKWALPVLVAAALLALFCARTLPLFFTWRGRRLLLSRWRRLTRWEYWPLWAASGPVFFYVLYLGFIKLRRPTFFTVVNPGIAPDSGFIGESKDAIYRSLASAGEAILPWEKIPAEAPLSEKWALFSSFLERENLSYPVVLKSDEGQRSLGVSVIRSAEAARAYLAAAPGATLAQKYCPGVEFGVFYLRLPSWEKGRILSITEKYLSYVTGDGVSTLEELILRDRRAVCMAKVFLARFEERLESVPAAGEKVELVDIGTHAQGALFTDGAKYNTPELLAEIERISRSFKGFHLGRYDLRAPSALALTRGEGIRIIELNGVTGQCSHVYAPGNSVFYAWRTIMAQWDYAAAIARENIALGHKPMPVTAFLQHWKAAARRQRLVRENLAAPFLRPAAAPLSQSLPEEGAAETAPLP
jgi:membrane protein DedA with SNARE-associated domain